MLSLPAAGPELLERSLRVVELLRDGGASAQASALVDKLVELYPDDVRLQVLKMRMAPGDDTAEE